MAPKRATRSNIAPETTNTTSVTNAQLQAMINQGVTAALAARDANTNGVDSHNSGTYSSMFGCLFQLVGELLIVVMIRLLSVPGGLRLREIRLLVIRDLGIGLWLGNCVVDVYWLLWFFVDLLVCLALARGDVIVGREVMVLVWILFVEVSVVRCYVSWGVMYWVDCVVTCYSALDSGAVSSGWFGLWVWLRGFLLDEGCGFGDIRGLGQWLLVLVSGRQLLAGRINMLFRDRRAHVRTTRLMETEARMPREAWGRSMDASDLVRAEVMSLRTIVLAQQSQIRELQTADRRRQTVITRWEASSQEAEVSYSHSYLALKA
ncbi:hypothetical protein Tco_0503187 [Tanacetum coccineum]